MYHIVSVESSSLLLHSIKCDLFVLRDDSFLVWFGFGNNFSVMFGWSMNV